MKWASEQMDAARSFGFTGGYFHANCCNGSVSKAVLNALAWATMLKVPANGIESKVSGEELKANLDPKPKKTAMETPKVFQRVAAI